jgi:hypothetical protein
LAVLATLSTTRTRHLLDHGESNAAALTSGYHLAFAVGAVLVLAAIAVTLIVLRSAPEMADDLELEDDETEYWAEPLEAGANI